MPKLPNKPSNVSMSDIVQSLNRATFAQLEAEKEKEKAALYTEWMAFAAINFHAFYGIVTPNQPLPTREAYNQWQLRIVEVICTLDSLHERTTQYMEKNFCQKFPPKNKKTKGAKHES